MTKLKTRTRATTCSRCGTSIPGMTAERCPDCGGPELEGMTYNPRNGTLEMICPDCGDSFNPADENDLTHIDCMLTVDEVGRFQTETRAPVTSQGAHANCTHPSTKAARAACRRARSKAH